MYALKTQAGMGAYENLGGSWSWMFNPPPYGWLGPANPAADPPMKYPNGLSGCGCGGSCGGCGHGVGMFEAGFDYTRWGAAEWGFVIVGAYLTLSIVGDLFTAGRTVKRGYRRVRGR